MYQSAAFAPAKPATTFNFTRLRYDTCQTNVAFEQSAAPGRYVFADADNNCGGCFQSNPKVRLQRRGDSELVNYGRTDVESDLFNLSRNATKCPAKEYQPTNNVMNQDALLRMPDCNGLQIYEDTRLEDPPCNLRGTGINRFEWPCEDPQANVEMPFAWGVQARMVAKDNHRPCVPIPVDITPSLPMPPVPAAPRPVPVPTSALVPLTPPKEQIACLGSPGGPTPVPTYPPSIQFGKRSNIPKL